MIHIWLFYGFIWEDFRYQPQSRFQRLCFKTTSENKQADFKAQMDIKKTQKTRLIRGNDFSTVTFQQTFVPALLHVFKTFHTISFFL